MKRKAVYPGSFDPITNGHVDLIKRASRLFDLVYVAVAHNYDKRPLFSVEERVDMVKDAVVSIDNVVVEDFDGLAVDYARSKGVKIILRGLRMISDFEYEFQMALTNRKLAGDIETIFLMPNESYSYLSSKLIKEAGALGANLSSFVSKKVEKKLKKRLKNG